MNSEKNLQATVDPALLSKMQQVAKAESVSVDELVGDAIETLLNRREWQDVLRYGEAQAKARNLSQADIDEAIKAARSEQPKPGR